MSRAVRSPSRSRYFLVFRFARRTDGPPVAPGDPPTPTLPHAFHLTHTHVSRPPTAWSTPSPPSPTL